jgi:malate dehydrogenase (oxaloacetate-decarboxylating)
LAYTPGVGTICLDIQQDESLADQMTFRARAVAIVSDGSLLNSEGKRFSPVMDWFVCQIKHYTGLDAFPFVVQK